VTPAPGIEVAEQDGVLVVSVAGDLDGDAREPLLQAYEDSSEGSGAREVLLDLARCAYISSAGIALVVSLLMRCRAEGRALSASGLSPHYRQIFDVTRLSEHLHVLPAGPEQEETR
jgi:anti-anti-sigma factor